MENLDSFKMLLLKILLQRWRETIYYYKDEEKLYSEEPCRQPLYWVKWSLLVMGQMKTVSTDNEKNTASLL